MRLAIIDTEHFEVLYTLLRLSTGDQMMAGAQVQVYTTESNAQQLRSLPGMDHPMIDWILKTKKESATGFAMRVVRLIRKNPADVLWLSTVADNHLLYARLLDGKNAPRSILSLHNVNGYFDYKVSFSIKRLLRFTGKKSLLKKAQVLHVLSNGVAQYLRSRLLKTALQDKVVHVLPGAFFEPGIFPSTEYKTGEKLRIVIPGSIDDRRRSYNQVFSLLDKINQQKLPAEIILLGSFQEEHSGSTRDKVRKYQLLYNNLKSFEGPEVDQPLFDAQLAAAHFIWMPSMRDAVIQDDVLESYGVSISSGNNGDIIRFAKPFIAPVFLRFDDGFEPSCFRYEKTSAIAGMISNLTPASYQLKAALAEKLSMTYRLDDLLPSFRSLLALADQ
ncbi:MAG: hypothetical protein EOO05_11090 [Chitinophagaceae bacterium]|nr:MAG: hypothetical protein EOO05_11090 [Chitinophagaceae bacterium]